MNDFVELDSHHEATGLAGQPQPGDAPEQYRLTQRDRDLMRDLRYQQRENQTEFWQRFGVAQSSGSRFERGLPVPQPILLLVRLYFLRLINDKDLQRVRSPGYEQPQRVPARRG
jgi:hypothetical protein